MDYVIDAELKIGYKGTLFKEPKAEFEVTVGLPDVPERFDKFVREGFSKLFTPILEKMVKERSKAFRDAMDATETAIAKKKLGEEEMKKFVEVANSSITQGLRSWTDIEVPRAAQECLEKVRAALEKKLNTKFNWKAVKTVVKTVVLILITVAAAAAAIAGTVLTGGVLAVVVLASVGTGIGAIAASVKTASDAYDSYTGILKKIKKDIEEVDASIEYQKKKEKALDTRKGGKLGPKEAIKLFLSATGPKIASLRKHLKEADERQILANKDRRKAKVALEKIKQELEVARNSPNKDLNKMVADLTDQSGRLESAIKRLDGDADKFDKFKQDAEKLIAEYEKSGEWKGSKLMELAKFVEVHQESVGILIDAGKTMATGIAKILKALGR